MVTIVDNEAKGLDLGAANYLIKPVERDRLADLVEKHRIARTSTVMEAEAVLVPYLPDGPTGRKTAGSRVPRARRN